MGNREKKKFGPTPLEKKAKKIRDAEFQEFLDRRRKALEDAESKIDRTRPQWHICEGCRFLEKNSGQFICTCGTFTGRRGESVRCWNPGVDPVPWSNRCPMATLHQVYKNGSDILECQIPDIRMRWEQCMNRVSVVNYARRHDKRWNPRMSPWYPHL